MSFRIGQYAFEGLFAIPAYLNDQSGVYAIVDSSNYQVLDIGESGGVRSRVETHDRADQWRRNCQGSVQYAALYCDGSNRMRIERELRAQFSPRCGDR